MVSARIRETTKKLLFSTDGMTYSKMSKIRKNIKNDALHEACLYGTLQSVKDLVFSGKIYIDCEDKDGITPLGRIAMVAYVRRPMDMEWIFIKDREEKIKFLLKNGADPLKPLGEETVAEMIFRSENKGLICMMLSYIKDINAPLNCFGETALLIAVRRGFYSITKKVLGMNADVNKGSFFTDNPLSCVALFKKAEFISFPVEDGGSVEERNGFGETHLHVACYNSPEDEIIKKCLEHNNPYYRKGDTVIYPLYRATDFTLKTVMTTELVELFLDRGLDVNAKDLRGRSPLDFCFRRRNAQIASIFLRNGAHLEITDNKSVYLLKYIPTSSFKTNETAKVILRYIALENCKGTPLNEVLKERLGKREEAYYYFKQCYEEINMLKSYKIPNTTVTYWKLLTKSIQALSKYARNEFIVEKIRTFDEGLYPIYYSDILYKFEKGSKRMELIDEGAAILSRHWVWNLPLNCVEDVFDHLWIADLENLKVAGQCIS